MDDRARESLALLVVKPAHRDGRESIGRAAEIAGIGKLAFIDALGKLGVPVIAFGIEQAEEEFRDE